MDLAHARHIANQVVGWLRPACERIDIAGSIRRGVPDVTDIEIVALPLRAPRPTFGDARSGRSPLDALLATLDSRGDLRLDERLPRNGPRYKRLRSSSGVTVHLYLATDDNYGITLAARTGDAEFARRLVLPHAMYGLIPGGLRLDLNGSLYRVDGSTETMLSCPDEATFFGYLGIDDVPDPADRTEATARRLATLLGLVPERARVHA